MRSKRLKFLKLQMACAVIGIPPGYVKADSNSIRKLTASDNATIEKAKAKRLRKMKAKIERALSNL